MQDTALGIESACYLLHNSLMVDQQNKRPDVYPLPQDPPTPVERQQPTPVREYVPQAPVPETSPHHPTPEQQAEFSREQLQQRQEQGQQVEGEVGALKRLLRKQKKKKNTIVPQVRDEMTVQIESIMEAGLEEAFKEMTPIQKQEFKMKGEEVARTLRQMFKGAHVRVKKVFKLIVEWLQMLPGVNKFFLEQEAKIKADKIIALKERFPGKK